MKIATLILMLLMTAISHQASAAMTTPSHKAAIARSDRLRDTGNLVDALKIVDSLATNTPEDDIETRCAVLDARIKLMDLIGNYPAMLKDVREIVNLDKPKRLGYYDILAYLYIAEFHRKFGRDKLVYKYINKAKALKLKNVYKDMPVSDIEYLEKLYALSEAKYLIYKDSVTSGIRALEQGINSISDKGEKRVLENYRDEAICRYLNRGSLIELYSRILQQDSAILTAEERTDKRIKLIRCLTEQGDIRRAHEELERLAPDTHKPEIRAAYLVYSSELAEKEHDYFTQAKNYIASQKILDSLSDVYATTLTQVETDYFEIAEAEHEAKSNRQLSKSKTIWICILLILLCVAVVSAFTITWRHRKRHHSQRITEKKLGNRNAEVTALHDRLKTLENSCKQIEEIMTSPGSDTTKISALNEILKTVSRTDSPLDFDIESHDTSTAEFLAKLSIVHPNLTNAERRMAVLVMQNLSNKDIANRISRAVSTVKSTKNALSKKLSPDMPIAEYLRNLSSMDDTSLYKLAGKIDSTRNYRKQ